MKKIAILGSTGSIGTQTLKIIRDNPDEYKVVSLVAYKNKALLAAQAKEFLPVYAGLLSEDRLALAKAAASGADMVVVATSGITALQAVLDCVRNGTDVALANKETLVTGGALVMGALRKSGSLLLPVDSEHSAVFQCMERAGQKPKRIILTASGGAFRGKTAEELKNAGYASALAHPTWSMGEKITIDSATMFNKTLEVIEAKWLFGLETDKIDILIHPQSTVHSMAEFDGGTILGQVYPPTMLEPIGYALSYPAEPRHIREIDLSENGFEFSQPDKKNFPCVTLAYDGIMAPPLMPAVMNGANETCVEMFRQNQLCFTDFWNIIHSTCEHFYRELTRTELTVPNIVLFDLLAKQYAERLIRKG